MEMAWLMENRNRWKTSAGPFKKTLTFDVTKMVNGFKVPLKISSGVSEPRSAVLQPRRLQQRHLCPLHLLMWMSGNKHLMWTWYAVFATNVNPRLYLRFAANVNCWHHILATGLNIQTLLLESGKNMKASWRDKTWNKSTVPKPINKMWEKQNKIYNEKDRMKKKTLQVILASCWLRCWWQSDVNKHTTGNMEVGKNDRGCAHRSTFPMEVKDKEEWCEWWPDYDIDLARNNPRCVCVCSAWAHSSTKAAWTLWSLHIPAHRDLTKISDASSMNEASYFEFHEH